MSLSVASLDSRFSFVIFWSFYFFVLLFSFLWALFHPSFRLYGWLFTPLVANFFLGYLVNEIDKVAKIIIASFVIHSGVIIGLFNVSSVYEAFLSSVDFLGYDPSTFLVIIIVVYYLMHIALGITVSWVGQIVKERSLH